MNQKYILSIDQGTSGTKAVLFNSDGELICRHTCSHRQIYPKPGWVEHDAEEIYDKTLEALRVAIELSGIHYEQITAVSISNQRETIVVWDKRTGKPVYNAIVWQCQRGTEICSRLASDGIEALIQEKTGLKLSPYFSAAKIKWILDHVPGAKENAENGHLIFGTMDSWLLWKLTDGKVHATDYSNASRTQLFNIKTLSWDIEILKLFGIPLSMAPSVYYSDYIFGTISPSLGIGNIPITGVMGDSHAALFGQNCFNSGMVKATYGTGSSIMANIGKSPVWSKKGLVTSLAWGINGEIEYVLEGNINCTGATIKWLVDDLELISSSREAGNIAASVVSNEGVYLVPAFVGLSAPYWDSEARASITGMTRGTKKAHIVRAAEESIAYQIKDIVDLIKDESGIILSDLRVDGGPTRDDFLMQFQADVLNLPVSRPKIEELSAIGAAFMAGLATGVWSCKEEICHLRKTDPAFMPSMQESLRINLYKGWREAVDRVLYHPK